MNEYFKDLVDDITSDSDCLISYCNKNYTIKISSIIADAPARAFIKNIKGHMGYYGCEGCKQEGVYTKHKNYVS